MKRTALLVLPLALTGCYTQTHITRTVKHPDGSTETYENRSNGYNYNPNFIGSWENNYQIRANSVNNQQIGVQVPPAPWAQNQFSVQ